MNWKKKVTKLIPNNIKEYIRPSMKREAPGGPTEYVVRLSDLKKLSGKRIIVTGCTGAIGSAICYRLLLEGAIVGMAGRDLEKVQELIRKIKKEISEGVAIPLLLDVTNDESVDMAISEFVKITGGVDALVNNAGGGARAESKCIHEQDINVIDKVINTNLRGSIICAQRVAQEMVQKNAGKIINMSSVVAMCGKRTMSDYAAAKAGIIGFTKSLALELGEFNITVNCISPGMVNQIPFDAGLTIRATKTNCLKRFGYTDEVANLVEFILSDDANYITGHNFVIDGGRSLGLMGD